MGIEASGGGGGGGGDTHEVKQALCLNRKRSYRGWGGGGGGR